MNKKELKVLSEAIERKLSENYSYLILDKNSIYNFVKDNHSKANNSIMLYRLFEENILKNQKKILDEIDFILSSLISKRPEYKAPLNFIKTLVSKEVITLPAIKESDIEAKIKLIEQKFTSIEKVLDLPLDSVSIINIYEQDSAKDAVGHFILCVLLGNDSKFTYKNKRFYFAFNEELSWDNGKTHIQLNDVIAPLKNIFKKLSKSDDLTQFKNDILMHSSTVIKNEIINMISESDASLKRLADELGIYDFTLLLNESHTTISDCEINECLNSIVSTLKDREISVKKNLLNTLKEFGLNQRKLKDFYSRRKPMKITLYCGETNSGKTYQSFQHMKHAKSGVYMAPLRLLAMEGKENIEKLGHECNLITGDYQEYSSTALFCSSTVEMLDSTKEYDVAILDEVQLIFNKDRGWAWSHALLSIRTDHLILTGNLEVATHIEKLSKYMGCELEVVYLERKTELLKYSHEIYDYDDVPDNSAIIAFSKRDVITIKDQYEKTTGKKASVIFGALTPKLRQLESVKFRTGESNIVVATDAVSMGLNLPIENVFFYSLEKFDGRAVGFIDSDLAIQIIGRAGRYKMYDKGYYGVFNAEEITLDAILSKPNTPKKSIFPYKAPLKVIEVLANALNVNDIHKLLVIFNSYIEFDDVHFEKMDPEEQLKKAAIIEQLDTEKILTLKDKYKLINAPISLSESNEFIFSDSILRLVNKVDFDEIDLPHGDIKINNIKSLDTIEVNITAIDYYLWLSFAFSENFGCHSDKMNRVKEKLNKKLTKFLSSKNSETYSCLNECGVRVALMNKYCEKCKVSFNI